MVLFVYKALLQHTQRLTTPGFLPSLSRYQLKVQSMVDTQELLSFLPASQQFSSSLWSHCQRRFPTFPPRPTGLIDTAFSSQGTTNNMLTLCLLPHRDVLFSAVSAALLPTNRLLCPTHFILGFAYAMCLLSVSILCVN